MQARLALVSPAAAAREFKLTLPTTIGRSRDAKLKLVHGQVSRLHCEIFGRDGMLYVRDLGSTNGTFVNDQRVNDELPLPPGATLMLGTVALRALYGEYSDELLPPGRMTPSETVRAAPQDETFRVTEPHELTEADLAESPYGFAEFEDFANDAGLPPARAGRAAAGNPSSQFDWLSEDSPPAASSNAVPSENSRTIQSPAKLPAAAKQLLQSKAATATPSRSPDFGIERSQPAEISPVAADEPDFGFVETASSEPAEASQSAGAGPATSEPLSTGEAAEAELLEIDYLDSAAAGAPAAQQPTDYLTPSESVSAFGDTGGENTAGSIGAGQTDADEIELLPLDDLDAAQGFVTQDVVAAQSRQPTANDDAPNYFAPQQADPTPLDDKRWRVPEDAASKAGQGQPAAPSRAKAPASSPAVSSPVAPATPQPAPTPPAKPAAVPPAKKTAPVNDDLENFFNSFQ